MRGDSDAGPRGLARFDGSNRRVPRRSERVWAVMSLVGAVIALAVVPVVLFWPVWQNAAGASIAVAALSAGVIPPLYAGWRRRH